MAKKSRTPDPPRRVQAPKARQSPRRGLDPERRRALLLYGGATAAAIAVIVVLAFVLRGGGDGPEAPDPAKIAATMRGAGCTFREVPEAGRGHIGAQDQQVTYKTYPPTTGNHHPTPTILGNYRQPVDPRQAVHQLEHGSIVIWYGPRISADDRAALDGFYDKSPNAVLISPIEERPPFVKYPKHEALTSEIALTAWIASIRGGSAVDGRGLIAVCPEFDEGAFAAFRDAFRGKGPERIPVDQMRPGT